MTHAPQGLGPIRVLRVDLDRPDIEPVPVRSAGVSRADQPTYQAARIIAFRSGRPVGQVELPLDGPDGSNPDRSALDAALSALPAAQAPPPRCADALLLPITVVVPSTLERIDLLHRCVASLVAQDYPTFDVIVVDNRPDGTAARAALWQALCVHPRVRMLAETTPGCSAARNRGLAAATGEIVAFTDDDVEVEPGWLRGIGECFTREPQTDCVTGPVLPAELETAAQIWFERGGGHMAQAYATAQFAIAREGRFTVVARREGTAEETFHVFRAGRLGVGASLAVRTAALRAIGGFDVVLGAGTRCMGGEDQLLLVELLLSGRRITFDPAAFVWHTHRATVDELTTQMYSYGLGYTAMLAAAARHGHRAGLLAYLLQAVYLLPRKLLRRRTGQAASVPRELARVELRGLINGPWVYWRSMRVARAGQRRATRQASGPATPGQPGMPSDFAEHQDVRR